MPVQADNTVTTENTAVSLTDEQVTAEVEAFLSTVQPPVENKPYVSLYGIRGTAIWWANYNASRGYRP